MLLGDLERLGADADALFVGPARIFKPSSSPSERYFMLICARSDFIRA